MEEGLLPECTLNTESEIIPDQIPPKVPELLQRLFIALDGDRFREILSWSEDGRSFVIHSRANFNGIVCPYLGLSCRTVFTQALKQYDFGVVVDQYTHENFTRNDPLSLAKINKERKGKGIAKSIAKSGRPAEGLTITQITGQKRRQPFADPDM